MSPNPSPHLSYLGFKLFSPSKVLRPYIKNYWVIQRQTALATAREEFLHPEGGFGIIFNFGDDFAFDGQLVMNKYLLDGSNSVSRRMRFNGAVYALGIRFHVGGAYPFLQIPLHELADKFILLDALELKNVDELYECLANTPDLSSKILLLEEWLIRQLQNHKYEQSPIIPQSLNDIHVKHRKKSLKTIADDLYISQRQLERVFKTQVGISPKQYARLQRIAQARQLLKEHPKQSTVIISTILGYYDQAHFIRSFKGIVGMTPGQYQQRSLQRINS